MYRRFQTFFLIAFAVSFLLVGSANAGLILDLTTGGGAHVQVADGGVGDANPAVGQVTFIGVLGNFSLNVSTGASKPSLGGPTAADLDLNSINGTNAAGSILTIQLTDTDYTLVAGPAVNFHYQIGGTLAGNSITATAYADPSNSPFGMANAITLGPFTSSPFAGAQTLHLPGFDPTQPFSITQVVQLDLGGSHSSSFNADASVIVTPEPGTLMLLGSGLFGLALFGMVARRRKQHALI